MSLLKTGQCFTDELALNCPTIVGCVAALPVGPAAVAGTTQVLGKDGQYHTLPAAPADSDAQALSISGNTISLTNGGSITLPAGVVADGSETKVTAGANVTVTGAGTTASPYVVTSPVQALSLTGNTLNLTGGGSVTLPAGTVADGSETKVTAGANVGVSGAGTTANPYIVSTERLALADLVQACEPSTFRNVGDTFLPLSIPAMTNSTSVNAVRQINIEARDISVTLTAATKAQITLEASADGGATWGGLGVAIVDYNGPFPAAFSIPIATVARASIQASGSTIPAIQTRIILVSSNSGGFAIGGCSVLSQSLLA